MLRNTLLLWMALGSGLAAVWPRLVSTVPWFDPFSDPFLAGQGYLHVVVALTMFCVGAVLPEGQVRAVLRQWPLVLGGTAVQYTSMPLLAWLLVRWSDLDSSLAIGVILVGCVPGAMASNLLTMVARGNVSYSVGLTTSATLLSPLVAPLALRLTLGATADAALLWNAALMLTQSVVVPTLLGFASSRVWPRFERAAARWAETVAQLSILWILAVVIAMNRDLLLEDMNLPLTMLLLTLNLGGFLAGLAGGTLLRLEPGMRRALMLEVGMQNAGVGAALATALFPRNPQAALPCGLFAFLCLFTGTLLAQGMGWRNAATSHEAA